MCDPAQRFPAAWGKADTLKPPLGLHSAARAIPQTSSAPPADGSDDSDSSSDPGKHHDILSSYEFGERTVSEFHEPEDGPVLERSPTIPLHTPSQDGLRRSSTSLVGEQMLAKKLSVTGELGALLRKVSLSVTDVVTAPFRSSSMSSDASREANPDKPRSDTGRRSLPAALDPEGVLPTTPKLSLTAEGFDVGTPASFAPLVRRRTRSRGLSVALPEGEDLSRADSGLCDMGPRRQSSVRLPRVNTGEHTLHRANTGQMVDTMTEFVSGFQQPDNLVDGPMQVLVRGRRGMGSGWAGERSAPRWSAKCARDRPDVVRISLRSVRGRTLSRFSEWGQGTAVAEKSASAGQSKNFPSRLVRLVNFFSCSLMGLMVLYGPFACHVHANCPGCPNERIQGTALCTCIGFPHFPSIFHFPFSIFRFSRAVQGLTAGMFPSVA